MGKRESKIAVLNGVREYEEGFTPELVLMGERLVVRAFNDRCTSIDLIDLLEWLKVGPEATFGVQGVQQITERIKDRLQ